MISTSAEANLQLFERFKAQMIYEARQVAEHESESYRNFRVGASALGIANEHGLTYQLVPPQANRKKTPRHCKECAEKRLLNGARYHNFKYIAVMVVAGDIQQDEEGNIYPTLRPCQECRHILRDEVVATSGILSPETILCTIRRDRDVKEIWTLQHFLEQ